MQPLKGQICVCLLQYSMRSNLQLTTVQTLTLSNVLRFKLSYIYFLILVQCLEIFCNMSVSSLYQENLARLQRAFARKWEFIYMQAEAQVK